MFLLASWVPLLQGLGTVDTFDCLEQEPLHCCPSLHDLEPCARVHRHVTAMGAQQLGARRQGLRVLRERLVVQRCSCHLGAKISRMVRLVHSLWPKVSLASISLTICRIRAPAHVRFLTVSMFSRKLLCLRHTCRSLFRSSLRPDIGKLGRKPRTQSSMMAFGVVKGRV